MTTVRVTGGVLEIEARDVGIGGGPIVPSPQPPHIDNELPSPPPGIWPPPVSIWPPTPLPPNYPMPPGAVWPPLHPPVDPGWVGGRPRPPGVDNTLPPGVDNTLPGGGGGSVDNTLPGQEPGIDNSLPSQKFLVAIVAAGVGGLRVVGYTVVDPSLSIGGGPIVRPPGVDNELPETPEPKGRRG